MVTVCGALIPVKISNRSSEGLCNSLLRDQIYFEPISEAVELYAIELADVECKGGQVSREEDNNKAAEGPVNPSGAECW